MKVASWILCATLAVAFGLFAGNAAYAQAPSSAPTSSVTVQKLPPVGATQDSATFDPDKATNAYLAQVSGEARAKSDAYFEGRNEILPAVDAAYAIVVSGLLLFLRISSRMRNIAQGITRIRFFQVPIYVVLYTVLTVVLAFPLTVFEDFFREHQYGLSNQNFLQWFGDFGKGFAINIVASTIILTVIYAVIRGARNTWWLWGTLVVVAFMAFGALIYPVFVAPMFNTYTPLKEGALKEQILSLARSNQIPAKNVYEFDASKQTKRISANVSGFLGTTRISLNDNLLNRTSPREVKAVLGHEMGHYALGHNYTGFTWFGLVFLAGFAFVNWGFRSLTGLFGGNWDVRTIDDPAGLPIIMALASLYFLIATPVTNTITRTIEAQADIFGVNTAREPDAFATASLKLSEYRKLDPSPWEEFIFYDHPSGRNRISMMMHWKAEHLNDPDVKAGPVSPQ
ncbi:MAG: M48 family metallopeptidase [Proteobacteria bacterium]|nr:M48 family metallopeptidase [Pseudomonadota bacterium]